MINISLQVFSSLQVGTIETEFTHNTDNKKPPMQLSGPEILMIGSVHQDANNPKSWVKSATGVLHLLSLPVFQDLN